ncbi:MAG TPA: UPF0182 family protein [Gemmatimonadales bacterium]|nr:UPF0182 family protein [Gemmatimonadales bacterium]
MNPARGRRAFVVGLAILVTLLVGGRWLAVETAERAWAATVPHGDVYLSMRDLSRLVHGLVLLVAIAWGTANLYYVYSSIGSVQLPRRLGDLEIVEAVPQRVLLAATLGSGMVYGLLLTLGTGDWWLQALLASQPPRFGVSDPVLQRDLGYYVGTLPWATTCKNFALLATTTGTLVIALLYAGIGSLRFAGWRPVASPHARVHLSVLLALLALALARAAFLDPAEAVAGLHRGAAGWPLGVRISGAHVVAGLAMLTALATLVWGVRERPRLLALSWGALLAVSLAVYGVVPALAHTGPATAERSGDRVEALALAAGWRVGRATGFSSPAAALSTLPVWDLSRIAAVARGTPLWPTHASAAGGALVPPGAGHSGLPLRRPTWLVVPAPEAPPRGADPAATAPGWTDLHRGRFARAGRPVLGVEADSGLELRPAATRDSVYWFGSQFREFALARPDTWPALRAHAVPLNGWWQRTALAWTLQSPELVRGETDGLVLLWRRDVRERLTRLAPFAQFDDATPALVDGNLWWVSYGYATGRRPGWDTPPRYLRASLVGLVSAATGDTRLFVAPGADSLATAWARLFAPLIRPGDSLPAGLRDGLPFPRSGFRAAASRIARGDGDTAIWRARPRDPYEIVAPPPTADVDTAPRLWLAQAFDTGSPGVFAGLLAGTMSAAGPVLCLWRSADTVRLPTELLGSPETAPGVMRLWAADGKLLTEQGLFLEPAASGAPKRLARAYVTWAERTADGATPGAALRALLASPAAAPEDTSLAAHLEVARRLAVEADSALAAGDLETFGRLYAELKRLLGVGGGKLAPSQPRR